MTDPELTRDLIAEDLPAAIEQAKAVGLPLIRAGRGSTDFFIPYRAPDQELYLLRLRCDRYDQVAPSFQFVNPIDPEETGPMWWPKMAGIGYARGDHGEVVYCVVGVREYHEHSSHRNESHDKSKWKLASVVYVAWTYFEKSGAYAGRGGV